MPEIRVTTTLPATLGAALLLEDLPHAQANPAACAAAAHALRTAAHRALTIAMLPEPDFPAYALVTPFGDVQVQFNSADEVQFTAPDEAHITVNGIDHALRLYYSREPGTEAVRRQFRYGWVNRMDRREVTDSARRKIVRHFDEAAPDALRTHVDLLPQARRAAILLRARQARSRIEYQTQREISPEVEKLNAAIAELAALDTTPGGPAHV